MKDFDVDFVVAWVDGNDKDWIAKRKKYDGGKTDVVRYRDYGFLNYWFRAVENYAPWVHKIYLVTDNQIPDWLDTKNDKVEVVDHKEIIDKKNLPTFNSSAIEINLYKIKGLSEHFVYFNDDMYLNAPVKKTDFFSKQGLPRDCASQNAIMPVEDFDHIWVNNIGVINRNFKKKDVLKKNFFKFFNYKYGYFNILSLLLIPWPRFTRFMDPHIPISILKSEFERVATINQDLFKKTSANKFRSITDCTIWLVRYYQLVEGKFKPRSQFIGKKYRIDTPQKIIKDIQESKHKLICINDFEMEEEIFDETMTSIGAAFENKLSQKSEFEKNEEEGNAKI